MSALILTALLVTAGAPADLTPPGPTVQDSAFRSHQVLNGIWEFAPALPDEPKPEVGFGRIWVPGDWRTDRGDAPGIVVAGTGPRWATDLNVLARAWYRRKLEVPAAWKGRAVLLDVRRLSTDANVRLDGRTMGSISWPTGTVDLTDAVRFGQPQTLELEVLTTAEADEVSVLMGVGQVSRARADLRWRGIMGDVLLVSRPIGAHVEDVFVKTSTRRREVSLEIDLSPEAPKGPTTLVAEMIGASGGIEQVFTAKADHIPGSPLKASWAWPDPKLWDLDQPNLYTLRLTVEGPDWRDVYRQRFGFREFWIEGRKFFLNGTEFRMRPTLGYDGGVRERSVRTIRELRRRGFNIQEIWPNNDEVRGYPQWWESHVELADELGWPLMGPSTHMDPVVSWWSPEKWSDPKSRAAWLAIFERNLRRYRNSPSILLWANSGNNFGHNDDQAPVRIGQSRKNPIWSRENDRWTQHHNRGDQVFAAMKALDPTRPFMAHQGGAISDVYTANTYLNLLPLQDREEWLSQWAKTADMPYIAVEFGTPLNCTVMRGRNGFGGAISSEPLVTEYAASILGPEAYRLEQEAYRKAIRENHVRDQEYRWWIFEPSHQFGPPFQAVQNLYIRNTWRAWRTWGISGGMIPWAQAHGWSNGTGKDLPLSPYNPGERGLVANSLPARLVPGQETIHPAGKTLMENNGETLAWIAGRSERWTEKGHHFWAGSTVQKTLVLINDSRRSQTFRLRWRAEGKSANDSGTLRPAETRKIPIRFHVSAPGRAAIELEATIGSQTHRDTFSYRTFTRPKANVPPISLQDPVGDTARLFRTLGLKPRTGKPNVQTLWVLGRRSLERGVPPNLESFVASGGRVLVMAQRPETLERLGFRVAAYASRRAFPMPHQTPLANGLDSDSLRDWTGVGTLKEAYPDPNSLPRPNHDTTPTHGWPWGMQGTVSSAMVEKPHRAGWTPLLEGEFDLAYTPLLTLEYGKGRLTLCLLDLEDQAATDPVANLLTYRVLSEAARPSSRQRIPRPNLMGFDNGLLDSIGLVTKKTAQLDPSVPLTIVGSDASLTSAQAENYLRSGGRLLFLPREASIGPAKFSLEQGSIGSLDVPKWPEARGLSASDLRRRSDSSLMRVDTPEAGAGGQLGRWKVGPGVAIFFQLDPNRLEADQRTYLRFTRWRQTRALTQVLANLGASFPQDARLFRPPPTEVGRLALDGDWQAVMTLRPASGSDGPSGDPGPSPEATAILRGANPASPVRVRIPGLWREMDGQTAESVFLRSVQVPPSWAGQDCVLRLGSVDDFDVTSFNGEILGQTDRRTPNWWAHRRAYEVPGRLVRAGENRIVVRVLNVQGDGGIGGPAHVMGLEKKGFKDALSLYHPDYRRDFELGDDPYRYYRW